MVTWSSWSPYAISGCCETHTSVLDLDTGIAGPDTVIAVHHDMFCPGAGSSQKFFSIGEPNL